MVEEEKAIFIAVPCGRLHHIAIKAVQNPICGRKGGCGTDAYQSPL